MLANPPPPTGVDWFVDQSVAASGDGTSAATAFKTFDEAKAAMSAGDVIYVEGGVYPPMIMSGMSGTVGNRTVVKGNPANRFIVSGGTALTGLIPCTSSDSAVVGSNWANMKKATVNINTLPNSDVRAANLCENGVQMPLATDRANMADTFFIGQPTSFHTADQTYVVGGNVEGFRKTSVTNAYTKAQIERARVYYVYNNNRLGDSAVASFDTATGKITLTDTSQPYETSALKDNFALINILPNMKQGEHGYVDNGDGTATFYVWPANAGSTIEYSTNATGIDLSGVEHLELQNFEVRQFATTSNAEAPILIDNNAVFGTANKKDILIHHGTVHDCLQADLGYAMVYAKDIDDLEVHDVTFTRAQGFFGIFAHGSAHGSTNPANMTHGRGLYIHDCNFDFISSAPVRLYTQRDAIVAHCKLTNTSKQTHGNTMNAYQWCHNVLFFGINGHDADGFATWQKSAGISWVCCAFSASRAISGGSRALFRQPSSSATSPGIALGYDGAYILQNRLVPNELDPTANNSIRVSNGNDTSDVQYVANCIIHGEGAESMSAVSYWDYNYTTLGTVTGANSVASTKEATYVDPLALDFTVKAGAPLRTITAKDVSAYINTLRGLYPKLEADGGFDRDMNGAAIDWTTPFIGPTVDLDAVI